MAKFGILNENLTLREIRDYDSQPAGKPGRILPVVVDANPAFDAATQKVVDGTPVVESAQNRVRIPRVVASLTAGEIARRAVNLERSEVLALITDLRNGNGTTAQRFQRVEKVCAWLLAREALQP